MIRRNKATVLGKQPNPFRWIAADDFARMVCTAYLKPEARNKLFYVFGREPILMKDLLSDYCKAFHPDIKKVSSAPLGFMKFLSGLTKNDELGNAVELFSYFEKVKEPCNTKETELLLGKPEIKFQKWLETID